ncbi:MAG: 2-oxo acid dehydrogenase subunit E2 [Calditrichaeota bacterium]|nr:MAG: 2-oxo acid dehydrogenase subunit E2 [Calditrichota bacterium]MBL1206136.1 2-oxo acid dehydrogenase subunit E2 [Calditrichota bacterium]NOG45961.1 2-oxo acid dehydrogenase subunit E2 [Calditrichota bacterium]
MQFEMLMPKMGESIMDGTILKWIKGVGDTVDKDEIILEISTDKVDSEIPTPVPGKITKLIAQEGDTIDVGLPIAIIETESDVASEVPIKEEKQESPSDIEQPVVAKTVEPVATSKIIKPSGMRFYSPVVMNIANENGISFADLETIPGTGLNGRVTKKDITKFIESGPASQSGQSTEFIGSDGIEIIKMDHVRKSIAKHMVESKQTSAHVSIYTEVDMNNISKIRDRHKKAFKAKEGFSLTYMPFIAEATIKALKEFPMLNASIDGENILVKHFVNLGVAVAVENGLLVPNIFGADERNITGLARAVNDLALRARTKKLKPDELSGGTFSISNFGVYGTTIGFPIINQPQVAILGVGAIKKRPVVINDAIAIRPILYVSLTIDHRLIDGAMGAQFLQRIQQMLEEYDPDMQI